MADIKLERHRERILELLDLFQLSFGLNISTELWHWKYLQNPLAAADPLVIVALDSGKIVGARPFLLSEMWLKDEKVKAAQPCDTIVHPEHRHKGILDRMNQFAIDYFKENGYALFYNFPNSRSLGGYLKQGWRIVSRTEGLCRFAHPQRLISHKLKTRLGGYVLGFFYDKLLNTRIGEGSLSSSFFQFEVSDRFIDELKKVDTLRDKTAIDLVRDESYLRWRFDQHPEHKYKYIMVRKGKELWGYAVVNWQEQSNGLVYGMIVDYLVRDNDIECFRILMNESLNELEKLKCDLVFVWAFSQPRFREELLRHFSFKSPLKFPYGRLLGKSYFVAREIDERVPGKIDVYNGGNWRVTHAYHDTA